MFQPDPDRFFGLSLILVLLDWVSSWQILKALQWMFLLLLFSCRVFQIVVFHWPCQSLRSLEMIMSTYLVTSVSTCLPRWDSLWVNSGPSSILGINSPPPHPISSSKPGHTASGCKLSALWWSIASQPEAVGPCLFKFSLLLALLPSYLISS